jgi:hypothetical protein
MAEKLLDNKTVGDDTTRFEPARRLGLGPRRGVPFRGVGRSAAKVIFVRS